MKRVFVIPAPGVLVPDPAHGDKIPPSGREVNWSAYWSRVLRDKSITVGKPTVAPAAKTKSVGGSK